MKVGIIPGVSDTSYCTETINRLMHQKQFISSYILGYEVCLNSCQSPMSTAV